MNNNGNGTMKPQSHSYVDYWVYVAAAGSRKRTRAFVHLAFGLLLVYSILVSGYLSFRPELHRQQQQAEGYPYNHVLPFQTEQSEQAIVPTDSIFASDSASSSSPYAIFYNVYIPPGDGDGDGGDQDVRNALRIVREQMNQVAESYAGTLALRNNQTLMLYYNTIGNGHALNATYMSQVCSENNKNLVCQHLQHYDEANEEVTLERVKEYCHHHESHRAIYMHSKGSYHSNGGRNEGWRRHMTMAVTDERCLNPPADNGNTCNVCGLMFFVMPSFMFRGNFWAADCSYVNRLVPALDFEDRLRQIQLRAHQLQNQSQLLLNLQEDNDLNFGRGRYASEHWILSHPSLRPCDLTHTVELKHWFKGWKSKDFNWSMAPIEPLEGKWPYQPWKMTKRVKKNEALLRREYFLLPGRILRWFALYNEVPPPSSWVWSWFPDGQFWRQAVETYGDEAVDIMTKPFATTNRSSSREKAYAIR